MMINNHYQELIEPASSHSDVCHLCLYPQCILSLISKHSLIIINTINIFKVIIILLTTMSSILLIIMDIINHII